MHVSSHSRIHKYKIGNKVLKGETLVILYKVCYRANGVFIPWHGTYSNRQAICLLGGQCNWSWLLNRLQTSLISLAINKVIVNNHACSSFHTCGDFEWRSWDSFCPLNLYGTHWLLSAVEGWHTWCGHFEQQSEVERPTEQIQMTSNDIGEELMCTYVL